MTQSQADAFTVSTTIPRCNAPGTAPSSKRRKTYSHANMATFVLKGLTPGHPFVVKPPPKPKPPRPKQQRVKRVTCRGCPRLSEPGKRYCSTCRPWTPTAIHAKRYHIVRNIGHELLQLARINPERAIELIEAARADLGPHTFEQTLGWAERRVIRVASEAGNETPKVED